MKNTDALMEENQILSFGLCEKMYYPYNKVVDSTIKNKIVEMFAIVLYSPCLNQCKMIFGFI